MIHQVRHTFGKLEMEAIAQVMENGCLSNGPLVKRFEEGMGEILGTPHTVAFSNGTTALHGAIHALGLPPRSVIAVPTMTFVASANACFHAGMVPRLIDVEPDGLMLDPEKVPGAIDAIMIVDFAGNMGDYGAYMDLAEDREIPIVADISHSYGATWDGMPAGSLAHMSAGSLHATKALTTAEGGIVSTDHKEAADFLKRWRSHGVDRTVAQREAANSYHYDVVDLAAYNSRMSEIHAAIGIAQVGQFPAWLKRRKEIQEAYSRLIPDSIRLRGHTDGVGAAYMEVIHLDTEEERQNVEDSLRKREVQPNLHYRPIHRMSAYEALGYFHGDYPVAESTVGRLLTLPLHPQMSDDDVYTVADAVVEAL